MRPCFPCLRLSLYVVGERKCGPGLVISRSRFGSHTTDREETDKGGRSEADFHKDVDRRNMSGQEY